MIDEYTHPDIDIIYVTENIPGPFEDNAEYEALLANYNSQLLDNCTCNKICLKLICKCLQLSQGENYERYTIHDSSLKFRLNYKSDIFRDYPIIECNSNCSCSPDCGNRIVQNGPMLGLVIKLCEIAEKGLGLFISDYVLKGVFICEYAGELLTKSQAIKRSQMNEKYGRMNYIFCLNEHTIDGIIQTFVDPSMFGNIGRYINHSCEPNCTVVPVRSETAIPRLAIFSSKDLMPGDEITLSYSGHVASSGETMGSKKECLCNTESCKGFLPYDEY